MTTDTREPEPAVEAPPFGAKVVGGTMVVGLFSGLSIALFLLWNDGALDPDVSEAVAKILPYAVVWVGMILGTNQLLKAAAAVAVEPAEKSQVKVYERFLVRWNHLWPVLTTSITVGYLTAVLADQNPRALLLFVVLLLAGVAALAAASWKGLNADERKKANRSLVIIPLVSLTFLVPTALIVAFVWVK